MDAGQLAPDALVTRGVRPVARATRDGYVLDGFPRTLAQAEGVDFDVVVFLDVADDEVKRRLLARGRADDTADVIEERLREYDEDTEPLIDHYRDVLVESTATVPRTRSPPTCTRRRLRPRPTSVGTPASARDASGAATRPCARRAGPARPCAPRRGSAAPARGRAAAARRRPSASSSSAIVGIIATPIPDAAIPCSAW